MGKEFWTEKGALSSVKPEGDTVSPFIFLSNPNQINPKKKQTKSNRNRLDGEFIWEEAQDHRSRSSNSLSQDPTPQARWLSTTGTPLIFPNSICFFFQV